MKLENFLVMIGLKLLAMEYLENTVHYTNPLKKFLKLCDDPGLNLLEQSMYEGNSNEINFGLSYCVV